MPLLERPSTNKRASLAPVFGIIADVTTEFPAAVVIFWVYPVLGIEMVMFVT